ncbi:MAG TPA: aspartate aminotransferase family protein [Acidimicrobiia bacterium]|nr:aspartate aminotransferase family protein [Acidimicrobiia bacterium]
MTTATDSITTRAGEIAQQEGERLLGRTTASKRLYERALGSLPMGVGSSFQVGDPYPLYLTEGKGSRVFDVDRNEYVDFHNGFGCMVVGHAHPKVAEAIAHAAHTGTHFAAPTEATVHLAEVLCDRYRVEQVRFCNSGTEATMHAIRVARAATGREDIIKIEGSYHGHHDTVMFSVVPNSDVMGGREQPASTPMSLGIPADVGKHVHVVPFNDLGALERALDEHGDKIACLILEPVMMNIGIAQPQPGYLQGMKDLLHKHGALLVFDEVKSGATVAYGGAADRYGVQPDLACWAKATFGGTPGAAFGGARDVMAIVEKGAAQQGTFNGNPLVAAAALATLTEVLTPEAYEYLAKIGTRLAEGCARAMKENGIPGHAVDLGAKGCVSYRPEPLTNYRDFLEANTDLYEASYPWMINRGVFMTPGDEEQWTLSVQHTDADIDRYVDAFADLCAALAG